ncbi:MAG: competence/damage-inducible protein A [Bacteroidia bacterium]|nr:competence/damage-inducible protein A [Bacteroidia bacterium]MDW8158272.1 competence/damage-inducible protein A [Bacteroidia bacterium]
MAKATLIAIGNEILIGRTLDTNTHWLAQNLNARGIEIAQILVIADQEEAIKNALDWGFTKSEIIISCGGLGGTIDDITRRTIADYFGTYLKTHEPTLRKIEKIYQERNRPFTEVAARISLVPEGCQVLPNEEGLAPGLLFTKENTHQCYFVLPGVPHEMKHLAQTHVFPYIEKHYDSHFFRSITLRTMGVTETYLATLLAPFEQKLLPSMQLAYNPSLSSLDIRFSISTLEEKELIQFNTLLEELKNILAPFLFGEGEATLEEVLGNLLIANASSISVAESCTGGALCAKIISVPGASRYIHGGIVAYANEQKINLLGVKPSTLQEFGAVSEQTAIEMAVGIREKMGTTIGLSTTGIAGPDGATPTKPVGTVWIGYADAYNTYAKQFIFENNRERVIQRSVANAMYIVIKQIKGQKN